MSETNVKKIGNKAINAGFFYTINNFLIKGLGIITIPIFSRLLSASEFGIVNNFSSWLTILSVILPLNLYSSIQRAKFDYEDDFDSYISSILSLSSICVLICFLIINIFSLNLSTYMHLDNSYINFMFIYIFFSVALDYFQAKNQVFFKYKMYTFLSLASSLLSVFLSLYLVLNLDDKVLGRILGTTIPILCISIIMYLVIIYKGKKVISFKNWKYALALALPLIPHVLANNLLSQAGKIMVTNICGYDANGFYSMATNVTSLLNILWSSFNGAWCPWFFEQMKSEKYTLIKYVTKYYVLIFWVGFLGLVIITPELIKILAPSIYKSSAYAVPPILLGILFQFIYSLYVNIEFYFKKNKYIPIGTIISAIICIALNALLLEKFGYIAASYITLVSYMFLSLFHYIIAKKIFKINIFPEKFICKLLFISVFVMFLFIFLYETIIIRYVIGIAILILLLIWYRNDLLNLVTEIKRKRGVH